jgi:hypothetical protein
MSADDREDETTITPDQFQHLLDLVTDEHKLVFEFVQNSHPNTMRQLLEAHVKVNEYLRSIGAASYATPIAKVERCPAPNALVPRGPNSIN